MDKIKTQMVEDMLQSLEITLPAIFARKEIPKYLGGVISVGTLANLGIKSGPPYVRHKKHAIYEKKSFLMWLKGWLDTSK